MAKRKKDKRANNDQQNTTQKESSNTNPTKTRGELMCSGRVRSSFSTSGTRRVTLVTNPVISHEWVWNRAVITESETYPLSFVTQIFRNG
jgi:hypothetical protein